MASAAQTAAVGAALLLVGAIGTGVAAVTLGSTTTAAAGLAVAGAMAAVGLTLLPALRRRQRARLGERLAEVRQKLAAAVRAVVEREQETGAKRVRGAIAPYERFVRAESEQLQTRKEELARLGTGLDALRSRIEALG